MSFPIQQLSDNTHLELGGSCTHRSKDWDAPRLRPIEYYPTNSLVPLLNHLKRAEGDIRCSGYHGVPLLRNGSPVFFKLLRIRTLSL
jgi:hypothetical protein